MQLSGVSPLDIAMATAQVQQAIALQLQAKALWIPNLNAGTEISGMTANNRTCSRGKTFRSGGRISSSVAVRACRWGWPMPFSLPLPQRQVVGWFEADVQRHITTPSTPWPNSISNSQRRGAAGRYRGISLPRRTTGNDHQRAGAELDPAAGDRPACRRAAESATDPAESRSATAGSQARLAEILLLDPTTMLDPIEPPFLQVTLVSADRCGRRLVPIALKSRPEITSGAGRAAAAQELVRQEQWRTLRTEFVYPQSGHDHGSAGGRHELRRSEWIAEHGRLPSGLRTRGDLAVAERWHRQRRPDTSAEG